MPILTPTNYREIHQNEAEALRSIYGDDFETVENKRSAWQVCNRWQHCLCREAILIWSFSNLQTSPSNSTFGPLQTPRCTSCCWLGCQLHTLRPRQILF
jgi:hypothetical protein